MSSDGGATWTLAIAGYSVGAFSVDPSNPEAIAATVNNAAGDPNGYYGLLLSNDGGQTWKQTTSPPDSRYAGPLAWVSAAELLGSWGTRLWSTTDEGATWVDADRGISAVDGEQIAVDPEQPSTVYLAGANAGGIFRTNDAGNSWVKLLGGPAEAVGVDPFDSNHILAQTAGLESTTDGGSTWESVSDVPWTSSFAISFVFDPANRGTVYALAVPDGVVKSGDGGTTWSLINNGLTGNALSASSLAIDPQNPENLLIVTGAGLFKSTDGGASWSLKDSMIALPGDSNVSAIAFDSNHLGVVYVSDYLSGMLFKSVDDGESWAQVNFGRSDFSNDFEVLVDPKSADSLFVVGTLISGPAVGWSQDGGGTWSWITNGLERHLPWSVFTKAAIAPTDPEILYLPSFDVGVLSLAYAPPPRCPVSSIQIDRTLSNGNFDVQLSGTPCNETLTIINKQPFWTNFVIQGVGAIVSPVGGSQNLYAAYGLLPPSGFFPLPPGKSVSYTVQFSAPGSAVRIFVDPTVATSDAAGAMNLVQSLLNVLPLGGLPVLVIDDYQKIGEAFASMPDLQRMQLALFQRPPNIGLAAHSFVEFLHSPAELNVFVSLSQQLGLNIGIETLKSALGKPGQILNSVLTIFGELRAAFLGHPSGSIGVVAQ